MHPGRVSPSQDADEVHSSEISTWALMRQRKQISGVGCYRLAPGTEESWMCSGDIFEWIATAISSLLSSTVMLWGDTFHS